MKTIIIVKQGDKTLKCYSTLSVACKCLKLSQRPQTIRNAMSKGKTNSYVTGDIELIRLVVIR